MILVKFKNQESRIKNQESRIKNQESRIKNQESRIKKQESRIKSQESRVKNQESRIKSQVQEQVSRVKIKKQETSIKIKKLESRSRVSVKNQKRNNMKKYDLEDRLVHFASEIVEFSNGLPKNFSGSYYGNQLLRSGGNSALNFGEAQGANTTKDYIHKASLVIKELKESRINLKILTKVNYGNSKIRELLLDESEQLVRIIATIIKNKKASQNSKGLFSRF